MKISLYQEEGYKLVGAAMEVYNEQGYGMAEEIYQESLEIELASREIPFATKQELTCFYKGRPLTKRYVPDLVLYGGLIVELKAVGGLAPEHEAQVFNYMRIARSPVAYLLNFGHKGTLEWKRFVFSDFIERRPGTS